MKIANRLIDKDSEPLIIAEIGINHNGSLEEAKKIVKSAVQSGAEIIKHQTHIIEDEMTHKAKEVIPGNAEISIHQIMSNCALSEKDEVELQNFTEDLGAIFISTPFSRAAADRLERMNVPAYKIGSGECNNYPLIEHIADFGKPIILSTGMNSIDTILPAVEIFRERNLDFALLHTTNLYPTPNHLVRLGGMQELEEKFPDALIGLSDHTLTNHACFAAVALGAKILERHFTDSMTRDGPDIECSMDPAALEELINGVKIISSQLGGKKLPAEEEGVTIDFAFATVVSIASIKAGEKFTKDNIWVKRPGTGEILAKDFKSIIGKRAQRDISIDQHLSWQDIDG
tara:strand:- start:4500 stop:5531 length:1032 start_codon:yes stop_codon:yes gene_type:complete